MAKRGLIRVPVPTSDEMREAVELKREMVSFAAKNKGQLLFLKVVFRTGDTSTVYLDPIAAHRLLKVLKHFLPDSEETDGSPVNWAGEGLEISAGFLP